MIVARRLTSSDSFHRCRSVRPNRNSGHRKSMRESMLWSQISSYPVCRKIDAHLWLECQRVLRQEKAYLLPRNEEMRIGPRVVMFEIQDLSIALVLSNTSWTDCSETDDGNTAVLADVLSTMALRVPNWEDYHSVPRRVLFWETLKPSVNDGVGSKQGEKSKRRKHASASALCIKWHNQRGRILQ